MACASRTTHRLVQFNLDMEAAEEPRNFIKTLPLLKSLLDKEIEEETKTIEDKRERATKAKQMKHDLHEIMDKKLKEGTHHL